MYKIENLNDKYADVSKYLKDAKDNTDHITIAASDGKVKMPKDLLLLTSTMMRDILASYPVRLEPLLIIPDESVKCEAVEKVIEIFLNKRDYIIMTDDVRNDIGVIMDLIDIDQTLFGDKKVICDIEVKKENQGNDDLEELVKEEGEDECLMDAIDEMERLLECEITSIATKEEKSEVMSEKKEFKEKKEYGCEKCDKKFATKGRLSRHQQRTHSTGEEQQYACADCEERFVKNWQFNRHQKRAHNIEKPFICEFCDQKFQLQGTLHTHKVKEHDKPYPYYCSDCGQGYVKKDRLREHREIIHLGLRKFQCQQCSKTFTRDYCLKMHAVTHTHEFPYKCELCGKRYKETSKQRYKQHIETCNQTNEFPYKCELCGKSYKETCKQRYKQHIEKCHIKEKDRQALVKATLQNL